MRPLTEEQQAHATVFEVELAREAMDSVGVDIALAVTSEAFIRGGGGTLSGSLPRRRDVQSQLAGYRR